MTNPKSPRDFIAEGLIALFITIGAWSLLVSGPSEELDELKNTIMQTRGTAEMTGGPSIDEFIDQVHAAQQTLLALEARSELARDAGMLYDTIMGYARECDIDVHRLTPTNLREGDPASTTLVEASRVSMSVEARYEHIARFIDMLTTIDAYIRPVAVVVSPIPDKDGVSMAEIECEVLRFRLPTALRQVIQGANDVDS